MSKTLFVDLAEKIPDQMLVLIGELTVLFGRLEHMVLLAVKRKRGIPLREARVLYKSYSLGAKLFGKQVCRDAEEFCRNSNSEVGLSEYFDDVEGLRELCSHIQDLTSRRNSIMHGLITTVADETILLHNKNVFKLEEKELWELRDDLINTVIKLNQLIPIPGLHASSVTGPDLDMSYDDSAITGDDPVVDIYRPENT